MGALGFSWVLAFVLLCARRARAARKVGSLGFSWVLVGFLAFSWVLLGSLGFSWVLLGSLGFSDPKRPEVARRRVIGFL